MTNDFSSDGVEFKYLIVNDTDRKFGLWVNTVGFEFIAPNSPYPLKEHPSGYFFNAEKGRVLHEYQLVYITKGCGQFSSECVVNKHVCSGRLMLVFPGKWHTYQPYRNVGWNEYYIGFEGPVADNLVKEGFFCEDQPVIDIGLSEEFVSLYSRALHIAEADAVSSQQYLAGIVMHMLGMVISLSRNKQFEMSSIRQKIEKARIYMKEHVGENISAEQLAEYLNMSYSWFRKAFREYTGYAPAKYFQELRIQRAKQMLVGTSSSAKEIAAMLGYGSAEHFYSMFKKATGFTPHEYRSYGHNSSASDE